MENTNLPKSCSECQYGDICGYGYGYSRAENCPLERNKTPYVSLFKIEDMRNKIEEIRETWANELKKLYEKVEPLKNHNLQSSQNKKEELNNKCFALQMALDIIDETLNEDETDNVEFVPCEETLEIWKENFNKKDISVQEEIEEVKGTISNERLWQKGCSLQEEINMHEQNIINLSAYLDWLENSER